MIIGIAGKARAGKTTVANYIRNYYGFSIVNFADPIKRGLEAMLDLTPKALDELKICGNPIIPNTDITVRKLLQTLGTEWGREIVDESFWIKLAENEIKKLKNQFFSQTNIVIGDVRFISEAKWITAKTGKVISVKRDVVVNHFGYEKHSSERDLNAIDDIADYTIDNSKSHGFLFRQVDGIMKELNYCKNSSWLIALAKSIN